MFNYRQFSVPQLYRMPNEIVKPVCVMSNVSRCGKQTSRYYCNEHARMLFGMRFECQTIVNGYNHQRVEHFPIIDTYTDIEIPICLSGPNTVDTDEIHMYCESIAKKYPSVNPRLLCAAITSLISSSPDSYPPYHPCWLDNPKNYILGRNQNGKSFVLCTMHLPLFVKMLLCDVYATIMIYDKDEILIKPTVLGVRRFHNDRTPKIVIHNKSNATKGVETDCVYSPLTIAGCNYVQRESNVINVIHSNSSMLASGNQRIC